MEDVKLPEENVQKIVLRANHHIDRDTILSLRGTKAIKLEDMSNTDNEYDNRESWGELLLSAHGQKSGVHITTWSSLIRNAIDMIKPQLQYTYANICSDEVKDVFEICLNKICEEADIRLNSNCPKRLFKEAEETDLIKSTVYLNNRNHMIKIMTDEDGIDWYICAVYTGEIIIMLEALLDTIYALASDYTEFQEKIQEFPHHTMVVSYINRDNLVDETVQEQVDEIDDEIQNLELSKKIINLQRKVNSIVALAVEINTDIENIQKQYNLKTIYDMLK